MTRDGFVIPLLVLLVVTNGCTTFKRWAYEGLTRDLWQQPDRVIRMLGIRPGEDIADLGAGGVVGRRVSG